MSVYEIAVLVPGRLDVNGSAQQHSPTGPSEGVCGGRQAFLFPLRENIMKLGFLTRLFCTFDAHNLHTLCFYCAHINSECRITLMAHGFFQDVT